MNSKLRKQLKWSYYYYIKRRAIKWALYGTVLCLSVAFILWLNVKLYARDLLILNNY